MKQKIFVYVQLINFSVLLDLAAPGLNHCSRYFFSEKFSMVLMHYKALLRVRVDSAKGLIVDRTHPVLAYAELVLQ